MTKSLLISKWQKVRIANYNKFRLFVDTMFMWKLIFTTLFCPVVSPVVFVSFFSNLPCPEFGSVICVRDLRSMDIDVGRRYDPTQTHWIR